ncbi:hypothetical protein SDRG_14791 [Saprolegnia diclina VS20]|uniref:Amino acid permease/ SLC12A domain-containing protein n=1 Tax=Saprolegnia diclina (strain VS20) TaxID=1156394 RepID=T0R5Z6_SAPDV|nr:hypothetical protein SDRG_14791 [Saprolegnia diclina VS20]EQC27468.1 hypothetical protein SDRG_14791 [Saprolegnia diclina VS20]|eukprot:XP_008619168.1 hypothetical protein SDRG_14791 [Saprolegnia diclina VS20]
MAMFSISEQTACVLSIPGAISTAFGCMFAFTKLLTAISKSKLIPAGFHRQYFIYKTPAVALTTGTLVAYCICLIVYYIPSVMNYIFNVCCLRAMTAYSTQCYGYIYVKRHFKHIERRYKSPFGVPGAIFSMAVWSLVIRLALAYYHAYGKHHQSFSDEEKVLFITHVAKFNAGKRSKPSTQKSASAVSSKPSAKTRRSIIKVEVCTKSSTTGQGSAAGSSKVAVSAVSESASKDIAI